MSLAILCHVRPDSGAARTELRLHHLEYMAQHKNAILAGGPTLGSDGAPLVMILLTRFQEQCEAEMFLSEEPYTRSGLVFAKTEIFKWSQVLPEAEAGALAREIEKEKERQP